MKARIVALYLGLVCAYLMVGCSTQIPTDDEIVQKAHISESFHNMPAHGKLAHSFSTQDSKKESLDSTQNAKSKQESDKHSKKEADKEAESPYFTQFKSFIHDKSLHSLIELSLENNTEVLTLISRIQQAKSQAKINTASMLPTLNAGLNSSYIDRRTLSQTTAIRPGANSVNANLSMSWELDLFGKLNALRQSSKKDYLKAQSNLAYAQLSLIAEVSTLYFTLRDNAHALSLAKNTLENLQKIQAINAEKLRFGLIDMTTYQTSVANTTTQKNNYETLLYTFEQNKNALLVLLNVNLADLNDRVDLLDSSYTFPSIATPHIEKLPSEIILSRPDIQANILALHSQLYKETNANASRLPGISLSGSIGEILYSTNGAGSLIFQIANSITAPLLNRTSLKQNYLIQQELSKEAYYTLQNSINTALSEIENALFNAQSKKRQTQNTQDSYQVGLQAYESNSAKSARGLLDSSEFLTQENTYLNLQTQLFSAQTDEILSLITLFKALGGNLALDTSAQEAQE